MPLPYRSTHCAPGVERFLRKKAGIAIAGGLAARTGKKTSSAARNRNGCKRPAAILRGRIRTCKSGRHALLEPPGASQHRASLEHTQVNGRQQGLRGGRAPLGSAVATLALTRLVARPTIGAQFHRGPPPRRLLRSPAFSRCCPRPVRRVHALAVACAPIVGLDDAKAVLSAPF